MIYLDNAATTKPCKEACQAVAEGLENFGNPSSLHSVGLEAEKLVSKAREIIANSIGADEGEIYFTSGATESDNTAVFGAFSSQGKHKKRLVTTTVEHPAIKNPCDEVEKRGAEVVRISPNEDGEITAKMIFDAVNDDTFFVSCMLVNNETGYILPIEKAFSMIKKKYPKIITHCDCVQGYMKLPIKVKKLNADMVSLSGHKVYAPKGIGALYVKRGVYVPPFMLGGGQEKGFRSGTESVPLIAGFGAAVEMLSPQINENYKKAMEIKAYAMEKSGNSGVDINSKENASPYVVSMAVKGYKSEVLLHYLEKHDIYVSSGSACSKGKKSSVLSEFKVADDRQDCTLRISISNHTQKEDIDKLFEAIELAKKELCKVN